MNIAYYSHYFSPEIGAPSARVEELSRQWAEQGHHVDVVTCFPNHPGGRLYPGYTSAAYMHEQVAGIDVHRHWTYVTPNTGLLKRTLGHLSFLPSAVLLTDRHLRELDIAIGTSPTFFAAGAAAIAARRRRIPFIMEVRDLWPAIFVELGILRNRHAIAALERLERALYREATRIVTVTDSFRRNLIDRGVPAHRVVTIPNGADLETWTPAPGSATLRASRGLGNRFTVLYLGNHGISQRLGQLLDAAARLRHRDDIAFLLVGDGPEKASLMARAAGERLEHVLFGDPVGKQEAAALYATADACVVPLRNVPLFDSFIPSKMFEIMAMERPLIGAVAGEAAAILRASGGAVVVPPEDSAALANAIVGLDSDRAGAARMAACARQFVVAHYSRRALAATYLQVMRDAVTDYAAAA